MYSCIYDGVLIMWDLRVEKLGMCVSDFDLAVILIGWWFLP